MTLEEMFAFLETVLVSHEYLDQLIACTAALRVYADRMDALERVAVVARKMHHTLTVLRSAAPAELYARAPDNYEMAGEALAEGLTAFKALDALAQRAPAQEAP